MPLKDLSTGKIHHTKKDIKELRKDLVEFAKSSDGACDFLEMLFNIQYIGVDKSYEEYVQKRKERKTDET